MASTTEVGTKEMAAGLPAMPLTLEGSSVLHQMFRFRWAEWRKVPREQRRAIAADASAALAKLEHAVEGQSAIFSMLGHKSDFMLIHFRDSVERLKDTAIQITPLRLYDCIAQPTSYLS